MFYKFLFLTHWRSQFSRLHCPLLQNTTYPTAKGRLSQQRHRPSQPEAGRNSSQHALGRHSRQTRVGILQVFVFDTLAFSVFSFALSPVTKHDLPYSEGSAQPAKASAQSTRGRQEQLAARTWQTLSADACGHNILFPVRAFPFPGISKARSHLIATVCFSIQCVAFYCLDNVL